MERFSYDRREGDLAVLVDDAGNSHPVPLADVPSDAGPGDMLKKTATGFLVDADATQSRRRRALELQRRLRRKK